VYIANHYVLWAGRETFGIRLACQTQMEDMDGGGVASFLVMLFARIPITSYHVFLLSTALAYSSMIKSHHLPYISPSLSHHSPSLNKRFEKVLGVMILL
jgi:hypothetical protein